MFAVTGEPLPTLHSDNISLVLLDRDGVINIDSPDFVKSADEWHAIPGALEAIAALQTRFRVAVCTNQSGLGRELFDEGALAEVHAKLQTELAAAGGAPIDIFFCPHHPDDDCHCRKPLPGLLETALAAYGENNETTVFVGDSLRDLEAAINAACRPALLLSGNGERTLRQLKTSESTETGVTLAATEIFADLPAFAKHLLSG